MIIDSTQHVVERAGINAESKFVIKASSKAFDILSSNLYSDTRLAIVRELSCNAWDAHVAAGNKDNFEIHLPTPLDPTFYVKDYGTGLSDAQVRGEVVDGVFVPGIYQTFFDSNKNDSNDVIGCLGLGSKTPFSYASQFTVESRHGGMKRTYIAFKNEDNEPCVTLLAESESDEPTGLTVSLAVKPADIDKFIIAAKKSLMYFDPVPNVVGASTFKPYALRHTVTGTNWRIRETEYYAYMNGPYVVQGFVAYPVVGHQVVEEGNLSDVAKAVSELDIDLFVSIGSVNIAPSREGLSYDKRTIANLAVALEIAGKELRASTQSAFDKCETRWDVAMMLHKISDPNTAMGRVFNAMHKDEPFVWKGEDVTNECTINLDHINMTAVAAVRLEGYRNKKKLSWSREWEPNSVHNTYSYKMQPAMHLLVEDGKRGNARLIKTWMLANSDKKVIVIRALRKNVDNSAEVAALLDMFGCPHVTYLKDVVDDTVRTRTPSTYVKREKQVKLAWAGYPVVVNRWGRSETRRVFSRLTWEATSVELDKGGLYVILDRFTPLCPNGDVFDDIDHFITSAKELGLLDHDAVVYGLSTKELDQIQRNYDDWVNLFDEVTSNFEMANDNYELTDCVAAATILSTINSNIGSEVVWSMTRSWSKIESLINDGQYKNVVGRVVELNKQSNTDLSGHIHRIARMCSIVLDCTAAVTSFVDTFMVMFNHYPMFQLIEWNKAQIHYDRLAAYINTVDA